ncbi:hypothetical protein L1887_36145 [Cichorium endivia]|nr:hypothetical protein L1887_36145 [Cichorium endivia]
MRNLAKILTVVFLFFFLFTAPSTADITSVKIRSDNRHLIFFEKFGFTQNGHVSVAISSVSVTSLPVTSNLSRPDPSRLGFFLLSQEALSIFHRERTPHGWDVMFYIFELIKAVILYIVIALLKPFSQEKIDSFTETSETDDDSKAARKYLTKLPFKKNDYILQRNLEEPVEKPVEEPVDVQEEEEEFEVI